LKLARATVKEELRLFARRFPVPVSGFLALATLARAA
jgi:hypothetical protein